MAQVREDLAHFQDSLYGLAKTVSHLVQQNERLLRQNDALYHTLTHQGVRIMAGITEENAAIQTLTDAVTKYTGDVSTQLGALQAAKDAGQDTQPFIDRLNAVTQAVLSADGALNPGAVASVVASSVTPPPTPQPDADTTAGVGTTGTAASTAPDAGATQIGADGTTKILP